MYIQFWFSCIHSLIECIRDRILPVFVTLAGFFFIMVPIPITLIRDIPDYNPDNIILIPTRNSPFCF